MVRTTLDGLGRTIKVETSDDDGNNKTVVDTVYDSCACSPLGKVKQVSRPYAPGATVYWTVYTYDALGRTTRIDLPGGTGAITYAYAGNTVTVTDPAGKWKKYVTDGMGNLTSVTEQRPAGESADHVTNYTYNVLSQMTQVSMTQTVGGQPVTQARTFSYDSAGGTWRLLSETHPETGTMTYTYNHLQRRRDAGDEDGRQEPAQTRFTWDATYQRPTQKKVFVGSTEDICARETYD